MANNLSSNTTRPLAKIFLEAFESSRVLTKSVNTQLLEGRFTPSTGSNVDFKRPHDYNSIRTTGGDISASTKSDIIAGKATGTVQDYFTVATEWENIEEALQLDQLEEILNPMARRIVTDLEVDLAHYMLKNCNLSYGTPGTVVDAWGDVAGAAALMDSIGVPSDSERFYVMNPFTTTNLAASQGGLSAGSNKLVDTAWTRAQIASNFGGLSALTSNALKSFTSGTATDRAGTLAANPDVTYVTHKDTMIQNLSVTGFTASATVKAGEIIQITGRNRLNISTRESILDATGAEILYSGVVTADVTLDGAGAGVLAVSGAAIQEANGQYNTVATAPISGDVVTLLGAASTVYQPNMFFHKQAFGLGTVKLPKLFSTDTVMRTEDGMSIRVSKYADGDSNTQKVRFDLLPAYATFNPFFAGQGFGVA
jgi:hypothetical protein